MAWGAYEANGSLVRWGPASSARGYCPDIGRGCHTVTGRFAIYQKEGRGCYSTKFPVGRGGAPMPYCMFFHGGFALHGSYEVPGYNASHGCIRLFVDDAEWLNEEFTDIGTPVIVQH
jgi:lipoprotein-anchoring transpeptidase ErfK/SrfK